MIDKNSNEFQDLETMYSIPDIKKIVLVLLQNQIVI